MKADRSWRRELRGKSRPTRKAIQDERCGRNGEKFKLQKFEAFLLRRSKRVRKHLRHMPRTDGRQVINLMAAARAGGNDDCAERLAADLQRERFGNFQ